MAVKMAEDGPRRDLQQVDAPVAAGGHRGPVGCEDSISKTKPVAKMAQLLAAVEIHQHQLEIVEQQAKPAIG